jgi:two-component system sensor histidine kinase CpxA
MQGPSTRLYWRMALYIGAALAAFIALALASVLFVASQELANYTATRHSTLGHQAADVLRTRGTDGLARWLRTEATVPSDVTVYVLDERSRDILGRPLPEFYASFIRKSVVGPRANVDDNYRPVRLAPQLVGPDGRLYAFLVLPNRISFFGNFTTTVGLLLAAALVIAVVAWLIARAFARPLGELQRVARELASGQIGARVPTELAARRDEVGVLAKDFNSMAEQISRLISGRAQLMGELSHELRSPLARLQAALALAEHRDTINVVERQRIEAEIRRLDEVIGDLLRFSRLDAAAPVARRLLRIDELLRVLVDDEEIEAQARRVRLELDAKAGLTVVGDPDLLRSGLENIVRNAIRYAPSDSAVTVRADRDGELIRVQVEDRGPGVPEAYLEKIFDPYVRVPEPGIEASAAPTGTGLGLAIARRVFAVHGGQVKAEIRDGGGLRICVQLPVAELAAAI